MPGEREASRLISEMRGRSGLSQAELARAADMPRSVLNAYERGRREPGVEALARIAAATGMRLSVEEDPTGLDPARAGRILAQVLDLADALPHRPRRRLTYPTVLARTG